MGSGYLGEAFSFLIRTDFDLYILAVALRFLLQLVRADFYNPISQFLVKITNPTLRPLRRIIPNYRNTDLSAITIMICLKIIELMLLALIIGGRIPVFSGLLILSFAQILNLIIYIFIIAIFIHVILSWFSPGAYNPATVLLYRLTEPLLKPARQLLPPTGGLDLSPIFVFVFLQLLIILLVKPLIHLGLSLSGIPYL